MNVIERVNVCKAKSLFNVQTVYQPFSWIQFQLLAIAVKMNSTFEVTMKKNLNEMQFKCN